MLFHWIWFLYLLLPAVNIFGLTNSKKQLYFTLGCAHTLTECMLAWEHEVFILSVFLAVCMRSYQDFINKCTGILNTLMFYFALCREHSHRLRQTLFLRLCPGGPLGYVSGEPGGWRRLHSSIVQSPQLPEQCSWGLDPCPSTIPAKGTAVGTSIHAGRWSHKQLLYNVIVQGSLLQTDKTPHGWIRFHYVRPRWYCGTRFCHGWHLVSKLICCDVSRSQKKEKTVNLTKSLSRQKCVFCCLTHVCTALVCLHWTTLILSWCSFYFILFFIFWKRAV